MGNPRIFKGRDLERVGLIVRHLQQGDLVMVEGSGLELRGLYDRLWTRRGELVRDVRRERATGRQWEISRKTALDRLVVAPPPELKDLLGSRAFVPVREALEAWDALEGGYPVEALGGVALVAPPPVLPPRSQETYLLVRRALELCRDSLPPRPAVLDLGCGSGVCGFLAAAVLGSGAEITATDLLPAALATTRLNASRLGLGVVRVTAGGDLFEPVTGHRFDLIIFNPPWATAAARSAGEQAVHDPGRELLTRFFAQAGDHLTQTGRLLLVYSTTSGPRALTKFEAAAAEEGFTVARRLGDKIKTHRKQRAWETVRVYDLVPGGAGAR